LPLNASGVLSEDGSVSPCIAGKGDAGSSFLATSEYIGPEPEACGGDGLDMGSSSIKFQAASEFDTPNNWF
jgi:hypothetical protein